MKTAEEYAELAQRAIDAAKESRDEGREQAASLGVSFAAVYAQLATVAAIRECGMNVHQAVCGLFDGAAITTYKGD